MKIGLVTPYVYPLPGGVNEHVRYLYENLRLHGHDVRIISSSHGLQRASEGDVIRLGKGFSVPMNGSVGTVTVSPRYVGLVDEMLERERFDVLHFHEPFVPFLSLILLRRSRSVNIATFHAYAGFSLSYEFGARVMQGHARLLHGRIAVSAAARHFIDRYFPGDYKVIPNGVDVDRYRKAVPIARWQDGTQNLLFVGRHEPRKGLLVLLKAYRILRKTGCHCRLLVVGSGPQEREARRYVMTRRLAGVEFLGRVSDAEKAQLFRTADVFVSPATGRESFGIVLLEAMAAGAPIVASDIHGYKGVVRRGEQGLLVAAGRPARAGRGDRPARSSTTSCAAEMSASGMARAEAFSWERVTDRVEAYYGFVIRRLAAQGALPPDFRAEVPPSPRASAAGRAAGRGAAGGRGRRPRRRVGSAASDRLGGPSPARPVRGDRARVASRPPRARPARSARSRRCSRRPRR